MIKRSYTTKELVDQLFANLREMAPNNCEYQFIAGYLSSALVDVAEKGVDELVGHVDWTNQQVEARNNGR